MFYRKPIYILENTRHLFLILETNTDERWSYESEKYNRYKIVL